MFKNHLDMIGRNEPVSKKAKFWQSYVRSLKGSEDIRANDSVHNRRSVLPELTSSWPYTKSIYDDPIHAADRITVPGYRYLPIHRETYGYSPRPIYAHNYPSSLDRYRPIYHVPKSRLSRLEPFDTNKAWQEHLNRLADIDRLYPSRYGLYLRDRACPLFPSKGDDLKGIEYDPDTKPKFGFSGKKFDDFVKDPFAEADKWLNLDRAARGRSPTPIKVGEFAPRSSEVAFDSEGLPIYSRGGLGRKPWNRLFNPSPYLPMSAITKDPFWWDFPELKPFYPFNSWGKSPFYVRDSYLSPVKRTYLWDKHPMRPLV
ncbi:myofilin isoform X2 [Arctopsyche grandis]|uniref:myofilin isoform X2 n=1 Tax=Arctopsyche grandis TaxID=121162 RepID=UPI00406D88F9